MTTQLERPGAKLDELPMLIGGELVPSESGRWMESTNPANEEHLGSVPLGSAKDVERAVAAAHAAQPAWAALSGDARAVYLRKLADAMEARADEILRVEVMDTGNTISKMRGDVHHAVDALRYYV
jgi:betaine-aldehyde dehydrogenase